MNKKIIVIVVFAVGCAIGPKTTPAEPQSAVSRNFTDVTDQADKDDETDLIDDWQYNPSPRETESLGAVYSPQAAGSGIQAYRRGIGHVGSLLRTAGIVSKVSQPRIYSRRRQGHG